MTKVAKAVSIITNAIKEDNSFFYSYQANIAMAFKGAYARNFKKCKNRQDIHEIANTAAIDFLNLWIRGSETPKQKGTTATDSQTIYVPNKETMDALEATCTGDVKVFANEEEFFKSLEDEDE